MAGTGNRNVGFVEVEGDGTVFSPIRSSKDACEGYALSGNIGALDGEVMVGR